MNRKNLILVAIVAALIPLRTSAEVKAYDLDLLRVQNTTTLTITGHSFPTWRFGNFEIADDSNASPTLNSFNLSTSQRNTTRTDVFAGLNSFIHVRSLSTVFPVPGQTGTGDTEGFVKWNPLSSWSPLGNSGRFCKGSNEIGNPLGIEICPLAGSFVHEMTNAATIPSPSFDFAIWTFDAGGDMSSNSYLWSIGSNRSSNEEYFVRGTLRANVPALSAVGLAVLGTGIILVGVRALRGRRQQ